jgi:hypothetical protein
MAINSTPKEKPTGDGNPTAGGAINDLDFRTGQRPDKAFETLRAAFALRGHTLHWTDPTDGPVTFWAERWGLVKHLPTIDAARRFLEQIGGRL